MTLFHARSGLGASKGSGLYQVRSLLLAAAWAACLGAKAAELDPTRLPPAAKGPVEYERDVRPIFEKSCLRCHGPEKPRSHFRLDNPETALKGGDNGIDIIPGDSAKSPLVHYVARLVEDMAMPPEGKGEPIAPEQIGVLRAWIDQGAHWGATNLPSPFNYSVTPALRWVAVSGSQAKFRELEGFKPGFGGGVESFSAQQQISPDEQFSVEGRVLVPDNDYQLKLELRKTDVGYVRGGFSEWRRYYNDTGGYYQPFSPPSFSLNRDLYLDVGRAWVDFALTLPDWPQIVLGYEYQFKNGTKSTLEWGNVAGKNIYPAAEEINEHVQIAKLDLTYEFSGFQLEDNARVELYDSNTRHDDSYTFTLGPTPESVVHSDYGFSHIQGMNTLRLERQVEDWWLVSGGYYYSQLQGSATLDQTTLDAAGVPTTGTFWSADTSVLKRETQILSLSTLMLPEDWLSAAAGFQSEWARQEGFGNVNLDEGNPNLPPAFILRPAIVQSDLDTQKLSENISLRFTKIRWTVLFAEARFEQGSIGQYEQDAPEPGTVPDVQTTFLRNTDYTNDRQQYRVGFDTSPWRWLSLGADYQQNFDDSNYDNQKMALDPGGYSAFINARKINSDAVEGKLTLKPLSWLRTTLTYQLASSQYFTTTGPVPGANAPSSMQAGNYDAQVYGLSLTLTPIQRLYFSGSVTWSDSRTTTLQAAEPAVVPYKGDLYSAFVSAAYALNKSTDLQLACAFSQANYGQNNVTGGLPLGVNFTRYGLTAGITRRWSKILSTTLRYGFYQYSEPSSGSVNDYTANGVYGALNLKCP